VGLLERGAVCMDPCTEVWAGLLSQSFSKHVSLAMSSADLNLEAIIQARRDGGKLL
jgi:hypothetical protein